MQIRIHRSVPLSNLTDSDSVPDHAILVSGFQDGNKIFFSKFFAYHFDADSAPDPACQFDADADLDPACHFDVDPDPAFTLMRIRIRLLASK